MLNQRISHAQLFMGAEGSEKLALAIAYAQFIACSNKQTLGIDSNLIADSCGNCSSCVKYQKLAHPDLHFIFPVATTKTVTSKPISDNFMSQWREALIESNYYLSTTEWYKKIGIENKQGSISVLSANSIIKKLGISAYEGNYKVMIIWMVEKMHHDAIPKILKILEEPPEKTLFILITEDYNSILKTITSRTQLVNLKPLEDHCIESFLNNNFDYDSQRIDSLINVADGNFKNLLPLLADINQVDQHFDTFRQMMLTAYGRDFSKMKKKSDEISKLGRENIKQLLLFGLKTIRMCMYQSLGNVDLVKARGAELDFIQKFSKFVNYNNAPDISKVINDGIYHIYRNVNPKIVLMDTLLKISSILYHKK
ncbi:MAG: hypothetical protein KAG84_04000 [Bacteroidales bacterium]|nr:hypothetical protein [Bacteroidales bacterium]